jgi:hypothetical protein
MIKIGGGSYCRSVSRAEERDVVDGSSRSSPKKTEEKLGVSIRVIMAKGRRLKLTELFGLPQIRSMVAMATYMRV